MKVAELSGALLDRWVARAEGHAVESRFRAEANAKVHVILSGIQTRGVPHYSGDWAQGGPIIEKSEMQLQLVKVSVPYWRAHIFYDKPVRGPTQLVAAMRAYVASKFGDEVDEASLGN